MPFKPLYCVYGKLVIPQRYMLMVMMHLALLNCYHLRVVLNIAMTEMVTDNTTSDECPMYTYEKMNIQGGTYDWPNWLEAFILYAFYIGYIITQIPGGWLADKIGARHVMGTCMVISIISTLALPISVQYGTYHAAIWLRAILGFAQGPIYPTISSFLQEWAPMKERGFIGGVAYGGANLGAFTGNLFTGMIIKQTESWPIPFYVWGCLALVWYIFYLFMVFSRPSSHPFITEEEKQYLEQEADETIKFTVPWFKLFKSLPVWAIFSTLFCHNYIYFTIVTDLPKYMKDILKMDIQSNAIFTAVPFIGLWISSVIFSYASDYIMIRGWWSVLTLRKVFTFIGSIAPGCCMLCAVYLGCTRVGAVTMYTLGLFLTGPIYTGTFVNINDISHHYSGIIMAFVNGLGSSAGIIGPWIVGYVTENATLEEWRLVFWIMFGVCVVSTSIFLIFAKSERQEWDYPSEQHKTS